MSLPMRLKNPFDEAGNIAYHQLCTHFKKFFGVKDAELFYTLERKRIIDNLVDDRHDICKFKNLKDFYDYHQLKNKI